MGSDKSTTHEVAPACEPEVRRKWVAPAVYQLGSLVHATGFGGGKIRGATDWVHTAGSSVYGARLG